MRTIQFPIFLACRDHFDDLFWKKLFENLAYGETPRGIYFRESTLYSTTKKKEFNYSFQDKTAEVIAQELYTCLAQVHGIKSRKDMSRKRELFEQFQQTNSMRRSTPDEDLWSKIKKKTLKDNLIQDFVIETQKQYNLTLEQTQYLYFFISVGTTFKLFIGADIQMRNGSIESVQGIEISEGTVQVNRKFTESYSKHTPRQKYLLELWNSYLEKL